LGDLRGIAADARGPRRHRATIHWLGDGALAMNLVAIAHVWNQAPLTSLLVGNADRQEVGH
jgi:hypothetical protein